MMNFMNIPDNYLVDPKYFFIGIPWESSVTWRSGCKNSFNRVVEVSNELEYFDIEESYEVFDKGIKSFAISVDVFSDIYKNSSLFKNGFNVFFGGDHSVSIATTSCFDADVIVFDAHADFRDSWNNSDINHACSVKQISKNHRVLVVGLRSADSDEFTQLRNNPNVDFILMKDFTLELFLKKLSFLRKDVYISIDVDVFDMSFIRGTGTPEPGGFFWYDFLGVLKSVFTEKNVVSADITEFIAFDDAESYSIAKLVHKLFVFKDKYNK